MTAIITGITPLGLSGQQTADQRTYKVVCSVQTTDVLDGQVIALSAPGMPVIGSSTYAYGNETDPWAVCTGLDPKSLSPNRWEVTVTFTAQRAGSRPRREDPGQFIDNPLLRPIQWRWQGSSEDEVLSRDKGNWPAWPDGRPFINPVGDPYPPEVATFKQARGRLVLTKNYLNAWTTLWDECVWHMNARAFWGKPPMTFICEPYDAEPQYENGIAYVRATFAFLWNPDTWIRYTQVKGPRYYYDVPNKKVRYAADDKGVSGTSDVFLNWDGSLRSKALLATEGPLMDYFYGNLGSEFYQLQLDQ